MFERFTDRARRVVVLAQEESRLLNHGYIGSEHLLLGCVSEGEAIAAKVLEKFVPEHTNPMVKHLDAFYHKAVEKRCGTGTVTPTGHIPFTPNAKKALERSLREALQLGHNYIGTEHVLLGLIYDANNSASKILTEDLGISPGDVRKEVLVLLKAYTPDPPTSPPAFKAVKMPNSLLEELLVWIDSYEKIMGALDEDHVLSELRALLKQ